MVLHAAERRRAFWSVKAYGPTLAFSSADGIATGDRIVSGSPVCAALLCSLASVASAACWPLLPQGLASLVLATLAPFSSGCRGPKVIEAPTPCEAYGRGRVSLTAIMAGGIRTGTTIKARSRGVRACRTVPLAPVWGSSALQRFRPVSACSGATVSYHVVIRGAPSNTGDASRVATLSTYIVSP